MADLRAIDRDLASLSKRLDRAEAHGDLDYALLLVEEIDRLLDARTVAVAALDPR